MSPSSRKKGKKKVGFWVTDAELDKLRAAAKVLGLNVSDFLKASFLEDEKQPKNQEKHDEEN